MRRARISPARIARAVDHRCDTGCVLLQCEERAHAALSDTHADQQIPTLHDRDALALAQRQPLHHGEHVAAFGLHGARQKALCQLRHQQDEAEHEGQRGQHAGVASKRHPTSSALVMRLTMRVTRTPKFSPSTTTSPSAKRRSPM